MASSKRARSKSPTKHPANDIQIVASRIGEPLGVLVYVKASHIPGAGLGLFARVHLTKNQVVTWYAGREVDRAGAAAMADPSFLLSTGFDTIVDGLREPVEHEGAASFANHATGERKNVKYTTVWDKAAHANRVVLKCLRDIAPDEELLVDYGRHYWHRLGRQPTRA